MMSNARTRGAFVAVLVMAAVVASGYLVWVTATKVLDDRAESSARADVVRISEAQVRDLTTLSSKNLRKNLRALGSRSTGQFKTQLDSFSTVFTSVIGKQDIVSTGKIAGSGVVSASDTSAEVIVSAEAAIRQRGERPKTQRYRMSVDLVNTDGRWLISGMEFVP